MRAPRTRESAGFTLIELMVSLVLSLVVIGAISTLFVNGVRSQTELGRASGLTENGRYANQTLVNDIHIAGFYGELDLALAEATLLQPADLPDPCDLSDANLNQSVAFPIQGYDGRVAAPIRCVPDWAPGTDVLVIRRVSTCRVGDAGCATVAGSPYFQVSGCNGAGELADGDANSWFRLSRNLDLLDRTLRDCVTEAPRQRFRTHIYYVAKNDQPGDGIPTLKVRELRGAQLEDVSIAGGVESLQLEYGVDINDDGAPDRYTPDPSVLDGCADADCRRANWRNVVSVRIYALVRSDSQSATSKASNVFHLGNDQQGNPVTLGPFTDGYQRGVFSSTATLRNVLYQNRP